ncbi:hypothetical protein [Cellulomonas dongxiuzhuiae]|uniref:Uncharacterized protein n=1 Tax=Cellulomonas dongxiuzhuiae TaxID=2819979 RepID=A0ABX8GHT7_9CELL|nr:hypothetical protein [Cellulomonas dongxiuzhuiae]MBO3094370.1 hypothetical protein [Cellulomonas dongxiuzhuiae]QWC15403.1 hypothetical protein KKR89_13990 [Cellulomonas dongxiuzhuiae]
MRSSSEARRAPQTRGTWVRLAVLLVLVGLLLLPPTVELTGALLTGTTQTTTVVSTLPEFPEDSTDGG